MGFLRSLGLLVATVCFVWVGVLWHWQVTRRDMSAEDIVMYLGVLPITLFLLVAASVWAWRGLSARRAAPSAPAGPAQAAAAAPAAGDERARRTSSRLLSAHAACAAGSDVHALLDAVIAGQPRPALDEVLRNAQGLPVLTARVKGLDTDALRRELEVMQAQRDSVSSMSATLPDSLTRAMALLAPLIDAVIGDLAAWSDMLNATPVRGRVRVLVAWPADVPAACCGLADEWLHAQLKTRAAGVVAPEVWMLSPGVACSGPELWLTADRLLTVLERDGHDDAVMLMGCHSDLDASVVDRLEGVGSLFGAANDKGVIPGEGAAALVLAGSGWPQGHPEGPQLPHLHLAAIARRDKTIDGPGRISSDLVGELLRQSLVATHIEPAVIAGVACDADQHSSRGIEMHSALADVLPHVDASADLCICGNVSGRVGTAATLMAVALAAQRALSSQQPWVALSVADPQWRLALVVRPEADPASLPTAVPHDNSVSDSQASA